jgi:hypothetical protein
MPFCSSHYDEPFRRTYPLFTFVLQKIIAVMEINAVPVLVDCIFSARGELIFSEQFAASCNSYDPSTNYVNNNNHVYPNIARILDTAGGKGTNTRAGESKLKKPSMQHSTQQLLLPKWKPSVPPPESLSRIQKRSCPTQA